MPKIKNIIIFVAIGAILVLGYIFFIRKSADSNVAPLVSSVASNATSVKTSDGSDSLGQDFLNLLLSVKSIKLDDHILSDVAFSSLDGSHTIDLTPDGTEGRPNPFAPFDAVSGSTASNQTSGAKAGTSGTH